MGVEALPYDGRPRNSGETEPTAFETLTALTFTLVACIQPEVFQVKGFLALHFSRIAESSWKAARVLLKSIVETLIEQ